MVARATAVVLVLAAGACTVDNDPFEPTPLGRLVVVPGVLAVTEGQENTFAIHVETPPAGSTRVDCASGDEGAITVITPTLFFTEANAGVDQTVTIAGVSDMNLLDTFTTVTCSSGDLEEGAVNVNVLDDDMQKVLLSPNGGPIDIGEGQSMNVQVQLQFDGGTTTVTAGRAGTEITVAPTVLTFTSANYNTPQSVLVTGVTDADTTDDADTLTASAPGATSASLAIVVVDVD
jgi:hypothetical protein